MEFRPILQNFKEYFLNFYEISDVFHDFFDFSDKDFLFMQF